MLLAFELGREYKLSITEIFCVFPQAQLVACSQKILIIDGISLEAVLAHATFL